MYRLLLSAILLFSIPQGAQADYCPDASVTIKVKAKRYNPRGGTVKKNVSLQCGAQVGVSPTLIVKDKKASCGYRTSDSLLKEYLRAIKKFRKNPSKLRSYQKKYNQLKWSVDAGKNICRKYNFGSLLAPLAVGNASLAVPEKGSTSLDLKSLNLTLPSGTIFELVSAPPYVSLSGSVLTTSSSFSASNGTAQYRAKLGNRISNIGSIELIVQRLGELAGDPESLMPYRNALSRTEVRHLFNKIGFGASRAEVERGEALGLYRLVDELVDSCLPTSPAFQGIENRANQIRQQRKGDSCGTVNGANTCTSEFRVANLDSERHYLLEHFRYGSPVCGAMFTILHNHFAVNQGSNLGSYHVSDLAENYTNLIMQNLVGRFDVLVSKMHADTSMLLWLNNELNKWNAPNENYGRELMELFALGVIDPISKTANYDEVDVKEMSRAMAGFKIDHIPQGLGNGLTRWRRVRNFEANRWMPDPSSPLNISLFPSKPYGGIAPFIANSLTQNNPANPFGQDTLTPYLMYNHPSAPRLITARLVGHFVSPRVSTSLLNYASQYMLDSGYDLRAFLKMLLKSEALFAGQYKHTAVKSPIEFNVSVLRSLNLPLEYSIAGKNLPDRINYLTADAGQSILMPPSVFGWKTAGTWRNGILEDGSEFLTGPALLQRERGLNWYLDGLGFYITSGAFNWLTTLSEFRNPADPNAVADEMAEALGFQLTSQQRAVVVQYLTSVLLNTNGNPDAYSWKFQDASYRDIKISGAMMLLSMMKGAHIK